MRSQELWSSADERSADRFRDAVGSGRLAQALLALEGAPGEAAERCEHDLSSWAGRVLDVLGGDTPRAHATALQRVLVKEQGFLGDTEDYRRPCNAILSKVMVRKRGLPVLLSAVWMEVGRRAGFEVDGLSMPGHFIARVGGPRGALVDPFSGGCCMSVKQCAALVGQVTNNLLPWDEHYLDAIPLGDMMERVLQNVMASLRGRQAPVALYRALRMHAALRPEQPEPQLVYARMAEQLGAPLHAATLYRRIIETWPDRREARVAERRLDVVRQAAARLH